MRAIERRLMILEGPAREYLTLAEALHRLDDPHAFPGKVHSPAMIEGLRKLADAA